MPGERPLQNVEALLMGHFVESSVSKKNENCLLNLTILIYSRLMKRLSTWLLVVGLVAGISLVGSAAYAVTPEPDEIVSCDVGGADLRGTEVCFITATVSRSGSPLVHGTDFRVFYQDENAAFGEGSAGFVVRVGFDDSGFISPFNAGLPGDVVNLTIAYPLLDRAPSGSTEGLRGPDIAEGVFAITTAADFSFSKSVEGNGLVEWIEFDISQTYVTNWGREACNFGEFDEVSGFLLPTAGCEAEDISSVPDVPNYISFYTPETFEGFVSSSTDGGYLNYRGSGISWFIEDSAFQFQLIGPRYADGSNRNSGSLQAFLPEPYMREIYGADFSPSSPSWQPARLDVSDEGVVRQDLSGQLSTSERNGGLLIELDSYQFSAPVFSFASSSSSSSGGYSQAGVPGIFLGVNGVLLGKQAENSPIYFGADRVAVTSLYELTVRPVSDRSQTPTTLASGTIGPNGSFSSMVRLPSLAPGTYDIRMSGKHVNGATLQLTARVTIEGGVLTSIGDNIPVIR